MSRENVEIVRAVYEAYTSGAPEDTFRYFHEDIRFTVPPETPGGEQVRLGHAGVRAALTEWVGTWADYRLELLSLVDNGDHVVAECWQSGRGKGSGIEVSEAIISVWTLRDGLIVEQRMFRHREQALAAAGLTEEAAQP
jgi:ketosteroid isomerase-like protein